MTAEYLDPHIDRAAGLVPLLTERADMARQLGRLTDDVVEELGAAGLITLMAPVWFDPDANDERWEVTGRRGFARVNRCTARGIQEPSFEIYVDGETRSFHALDDDWASSFRDSGRHWLRTLRAGHGELLWNADQAIEVLRFALAAYQSSAGGGSGVNPASLRSSG